MQHYASKLKINLLELAIWHFSGFGARWRWLLCYATPYKSPVLMNIQAWAVTDVLACTRVATLLTSLQKLHIILAFCWAGRTPGSWGLGTWLHYYSLVKGWMLHYVIKSNPCPAYKPVEVSVLCHLASKTGFATPSDKLWLFYVLSFNLFTFLMLENRRNVWIDEARLIKGLCVCYILYKCIQSVFILLITG